MNFQQTLNAARPIENGLIAPVSPNWHQGRTAYGGFSSALALVAAIRAGGEDLPPLRSAQTAMMAPIYGEARARAEVVRRGKNAHWIETRIDREGETGFIANFAFMGPVESAVHLDRAPPPADLIPVDEAHPLPEGLGPTFLVENFDVRFARPRSSEPEPELCWWVRLREREGLDPMVALLLVGDALPPGVMSLLPPATPISTMHWQVSLLTPRPETRDGWWLLRSRGDFAERGCSSQSMAIWNAGGEPIASGMQSVALFG